MTIEECRRYLPDSWTELIQRDPVLKELFDAHEYDLEQERSRPSCSKTCGEAIWSACGPFESLWPAGTGYAPGAFGD